MDWTKEKTLEFIGHYKQCRLLWCSSDRNYKHKQLRSRALRELAVKYNCDTRAVLNKIKSLRSYFHKEHSKISNRKRESSMGDNCVSGWFAYESLLFILDGYNLSLRTGRDSEIGPEENFEVREFFIQISYFISVTFIASYLYLFYSCSSQFSIVFIKCIDSFLGYLPQRFQLQRLCSCIWYRRIVNKLKARGKRLQQLCLSICLEELGKPLKPQSE